MGIAVQIVEEGSITPTKLAATATMLAIDKRDKEELISITAKSCIVYPMF